MTPPQPEWVKRLTVEAHELHERSSKLHRFLSALDASPTAMEEFDPVQRQLMLVQLDLQRALLRTLKLRLKEASS